MDDHSFLALIEALELLSNNALGRLRGASQGLDSIEAKWRHYHLLLSLYHRLWFAYDRLPAQSYAESRVFGEVWFGVTQTFTVDYDEIQIMICSPEYAPHEAVAMTRTAEEWIERAYETIEAGLEELKKMLSVASEAYKQAAASTTSDNVSQSADVQRDDPMDLAFFSVREHFISTPVEISEIIRKRSGTISLKPMVKYRAAFIVRPLVDVFKLRASRHRHIKVKIGSHYPIPLCGAQSLMNNYKQAKADSIADFEELSAIEQRFRESLLSYNLDFQVID